MAQEIPQGKVEVQHPTVLDTGEQQLAKIYAKALLGATEKAGNTETVIAEFDSFVTDVLDRLPRMEAALGSPRVPHAAKEEMLNRAFEKSMTRELLNFLKVVSRHGRLVAIRAIRLAVHEQYNELRGRVRVQVQSAAPLDQPLLESLSARLKETLNRHVDLQTSVDPELIGGLVIRVGDTVYDGSLANRLKRMRGETASKASQAIRRAIERFSLAD
ncbi:MAG: ATP synthase F1 subunit delta [Planctomycetales bacterium]|nr:ATP synthase F1 subunit delta [Planctomycetales bacterium]